MAVESYARPIKTYKEEQIQAVREQAKAVLMELIRKKGKNPDDYVFRDILPSTDLGLANEEWKHTFTAAYTEETFIDKTLGDDRFVVLYGYTNTASTPVTLYFKLMNGVRVEKIIHVQGSYVYDEPVVLFDPVGWAEGETVKIILYGNAAADDQPVFLGLIAEPIGESVSGKK